MAEAHAAVAFSFTVTPEGYDVNVNQEAIRAVWESGVLSWKKRLGRFKVCLQIPVMIFIKDSYEMYLLFLFTFYFVGVHVINLKF